MTILINSKRAFESDDGSLQITPLGAGCEVGRSCILVKYRGRCVMFDCGIHPAYSSLAALPVFDGVDLSSVDLCLVTHFHLDHCGAIPYLMKYTNFSGRVYMTSSTKAISNLIWQDYSRMVKFGSETSQLYTPADIDHAMETSIGIDFHQKLSYKNIKFTAYMAGHVLGACMFVIEIDNIKILYTGDYSREQDRHIPIAEIPREKIDVIICESTYGIQLHEPRMDKEQRFITCVNNIIARGGKCLLPVFALGRSQELLLILDEIWKKNSYYQKKVPLIYLSPLALKASVVYDSFLHHSSENLLENLDKGIDLYRFKYVRTVRKIDDELNKIFDAPGPVVVFASPGMLQNGTSRELFERWCNDRKNGVVFTGYAVKNTIAYNVRLGLTKVTTDGMSGGGGMGERGERGDLNIRCSVDYISFSAHADYSQTVSLLKETGCEQLILVHGEKTEMHKLQNKLQEEFRRLRIHCPQIMQTVVYSTSQENGTHRGVELVGEEREEGEERGDGEKGDGIIREYLVPRETEEEREERERRGERGELGEKKVRENRYDENQVLMLSADGGVIVPKSQLRDFVSLPICSALMRTVIPIGEDTERNVYQNIIDLCSDIHECTMVSNDSPPSPTSPISPTSPLSPASTYLMIDNCVRIVVNVDAGIFTCSWNSSPENDPIGLSVSTLCSKLSFTQS